MMQLPVMIAHVEFEASPGGGAPKATLHLVVTYATEEQMELLGLEYGDTIVPASGLDGVFTFPENPVVAMQAAPKET